MKYFAIENSIRTGASVPAGGVEITEAEYRQTLDAMIAGQEVIVIDGSLVVRDRAPSPGHTWENGAWVAPPEPEPEPPTLDDYRIAIEAHVDAVARERDFRHADSARGHINSTVQTWRDDAEAFIAWADQVWLYAFSELDKVLAGQRPQPTVEALIAELPTIEWPE